VLLKPVAIDFETYYDKEYSIKPLGVDAYVADPRFDPYLVSMYGEGVEYVGPVKNAPWEQVAGRPALAHNARFDEVVYNRCVEMGLAPETCKPLTWDCTADLAVFNSLPRTLAGSSFASLGFTMDKKIRAAMEGMTHDEAKSKGQEQALLDYALTDARNCFELYRKHGADWPETEVRLSRLNRRASIKGVPIDVERLTRYVDHLKLVQWEAEQHIPWDWSGNKTPLSPKALRAECRRAGIQAPASLAQDSQECMDWEDTFGTDYPFVGAMRNWRRANMLRKKLETMQTRVRDDGWFPYACKYFGGHTGRFSGDGGFNIQNQLRYPVTFEPIIAGGLPAMAIDMRSVTRASPGKKLLAADLAQIEARVLLQLAGDWNTLRQVEKGHSVYEAHAINTMGWDRTKCMDKTSMEYLLAKARVLALGFGCGGPRFVEMAKLYTGLVLSVEEAEKIKTEYRTTNPCITALWSKLHMYMGWSVGEDLELELPSGRNLTYYDVKYDEHRQLTAEVVKTERREKFYGGKLCENITQATARDVFVEGMLRLDDAGLPPLFHVHDEYVLEVDEDFNPQDAIDLVAQTPEWLPGCPIGAEGELTNRYGK